MGRRTQDEIHWATLVKRRKQRKANREKRDRKANIKSMGVKLPRRRWVTCIEVEVIEVPAWAIECSVKELSNSPKHCWFLGRDRGERSPASRLAAIDREAGGNPLMVKAEYRRCEICHRFLMNFDAEMRRALDESCSTGRQIPCGPDCTAKHWRDKGVDV